MSCVWNDGDMPFPLVVDVCSRVNSKGVSWVAIAVPTPLLICSRLCCSVCRGSVSWQGESELLHHLRKDSAPLWAIRPTLCSMLLWKHYSPGSAAQSGRSPTRSCCREVSATALQTIQQILVGPPGCSKPKWFQMTTFFFPFRQRLPCLCRPPQGAKVAAPSSLSNMLKVKLVFSELRFSPENAVVSAVPEWATVAWTTFGAFCTC